MQGTIKKMTDRQYGFITPQDSDQDLFFHGNSLEDIDFAELREGDEVTFEVEETPKGKAAVSIKKA